MVNLIWPADELIHMWTIGWYMVFEAPHLILLLL